MKRKLTDIEWIRKRDRDGKEGITYDKNGYEIATLLNDCGDWESYPVHYLIAITHVPNPNNYTKIRHRDGNILNNHADNLEWYE